MRLILHLFTLAAVISYCSISALKCYKCTDPEKNVQSSMGHKWLCYSITLFEHLSKKSIGMFTNVSSVVAFQGWWVLKSKLFAQESTSSKEILISTSQHVQRSLIFWASLNSHSLEKKWVRSLFHSHFQKLSALLIITL